MGECGQLGAGDLDPAPQVDVTLFKL